ncbi:MAG: hypothetical protein JST92_19195 [Deltaproteobacteria bacterium]|nr:hypothetical protein [Deltaproteobacteria bacterium]
MRADFLQRFNAGLAPADIAQELSKRYGDVLADPDEGPLFWWALAESQCECGGLTADVVDQAEWDAAARDR